MNQISCEDARLLLSLYIENMLSDEEMTQVREHLAKCGSCQSEYALLKGIMEKTKELPELEVSAEFSARLHSGLEKAAAERVGQGAEQVPPVPVRLRRWRVMPVIAAGAAVIALSVFALSRMPGTDQFIQDKTETATPTGGPVLESPLPGASSLPAPESAAPDAAADLARVSASAAPSAQPKSTERPKQQSGLFDRLFGNADKDGSDGEAVQPEDNGQKTAASAGLEGAMRTEQPNVGSDSGADSREPVESPVPMVNAPSPESSYDNEAAPRITAEKNVPLESDGPEKSTNDVDAAYTGGGAGGGGGGRPSGGAAGGLSAPASISANKVKVTVTMRFSEEGLVQAQAILADVRREGGSYVVPSSRQAEYLDKLRALDGFIGADTARTDYSEEYNSLAANGGTENGERMRTIDHFASHCYIVIQ